jgi:hypothetical protein
MKDLRPGFGMIRLLFVALFSWMMEGPLHADQFLPVLETGTGVYSNVTVTLKTERSIHIRHDGGIVNVELDDLDAEVKVALGYPVDRSEMAENGEGPRALTGEWMNAFQRVRGASGGGARTSFELPVTVNPVLIWAVLLIGLLFHLFFSYCGRLICSKAGSEPSFLIWLPVLQIFPMFRAAGMSGWWFLGLFVPVLNLVVQILWCIKIVNVRGKHVIWAILLILPLVNLLAFLYLAFSSDEASAASLDFPGYSPRPI